jgi:hypothetical protein
MCAAYVRPANMRRPEMHPTAAACPEAYSAAVPPKAAATVSATVSATMPAKTCAVSSATMSAAAMSPAAMSPAATMPAATAAAGVCIECEKRNDDEHHRGHARAGRQHQLHGAAGLGAPHRRGWLSLGVSPRTKSF